MKWFEPLIIIAAIAFVIGVIIIHFVMKAKGKGGIAGKECSCSHNCSSCSKQCIDCKKVLNDYHQTYSN